MAYFTHQTSTRASPDLPQALASTLPASSNDNCCCCQQPSNGLWGCPPTETRDAFIGRHAHVRRTHAQYLATATATWGSTVRGTYGTPEAHVHDIRTVVPPRGKLPCASIRTTRRRPYIQYGGPGGYLLVSIERDGWRRHPGVRLDSGLGAEAVRAADGVEDAWRVWVGLVGVEEEYDAGVGWGWG